MTIVDGGPERETSSDTARVQAALLSCPAGQAVELARGGSGQNAFLAAPFNLPAGVTLWLDPGVTVFASRHPEDFLRGAPDGGRPRALITVAAAGLDAQPAGLAGFGTIDGRGSATLLAQDGSPRQSWYDRASSARPALAQAAGPLRIQGVTLRDAPGRAVASSSGLVLQAVEVVGNPAAPGTRAVVLTPGATASASIIISNTILLASDMAFALDGASSAHASFSETKIYAGGISGLFGSGACIADSDPIPACAPAALPTLLGKLVQSAPAEVAAVLTVPDTRLPMPTGEVSLYEGTALLGTATVTNGAAVFDVSELKPGLHHLHARLTDPDLSFGDLTLTVDEPKPADAPATLSLTSSATTFAYGTPLTLSATLPAATGTVTFLDGSRLLGQGTMSSGSASLTISNLALGTHTVSAFFAGDATNPAQTSPSLQLQVNPITTIASLAALPASVSYGTTLTLVGSVLPASATGTLVFRDGTVSVGQATLSGGSASLSLTGLLPGSHTLSVAYLGDTYDLPATSAAQSVAVTQLATTLALLANPTAAAFGSAIQVQAAVSPADATGALTLLDGTAVLTRLSLNGGAASTTLSSLSPGVHSLSATYAGDSLHTASASSSVAVTINRLPTTTKLAPLPATIAAGAPVTLSASVSPASATGSVTFLDNLTGTLGQASLSGGTAGLTLALLPPGSHSITAVYAGDTDDLPSTSAADVTTVPLPAASLTLSGVSSTLPYSAPATLTVTLAPTSATGSVTLTDSSAGALGTALLSSGSASFSLPALAPGAHTLQARYSGDANVSPASAALSFLVTPDVTTTTLTPAEAAVAAGSPVLLNVRVAAPYASSPGGSVMVRLAAGNGASSVTVPLASQLPGQSFATVSLDSAALGIGSFSAMAAYAGDTDDQPSSSAAVFFAVVPTPTTLQLALGANPVATGTGTSLSATVSSSAGVPTGSVAFSRDGNLLSTVTLTNGTASVAVPALAPGTYAFTASYLPSGVFGPAVAPAQVLVVTAPVSITLTPPSLTIETGSSGSSTLAVTPLSGYVGTYAATCTSATQYLTCSVDPISGPGAATAQVHVHTSATTAALATHRSEAWLALVMPTLLLVTRRRMRPGARLWQALAVLMLGSGLGCGAGTFFDLQPGTYTVSVSVAAAGITVSAPLVIHIVE